MKIRVQKKNPYHPKISQLHFTLVLVPKKNNLIIINTFHDTIILVRNLLIIIFENFKR